MPWQIAFPNQPLGGAVNHVVEHREIVVADRFTVEANPLIDPKDRKSTRLNSSHGYISYAVFCLKKKTHGSVAAVRDGHHDAVLARFDAVDSHTGESGCHHLVDTILTAAAQVVSQIADDGLYPD